MSIPPISSQSIGEIVKEVIAPLTNEIKELRAEIQQLKAQRTNSQPIPIREARATETKISEGVQKQVPKKKIIEPLKALSTEVVTAKTTTVVPNSQPLPTKKLTYAGVLRSEPVSQASTPSSAP